jgi:hypothetical protein
MKAADAVLLAGDWVELIQRSAALTTDPGELAELDRELDQALATLEAAAEAVEQDEINRRVQAELESRLFENRMKARDLRLFQLHQIKLERERYGREAVKAMGLERWLRNPK